MSIPSTQTHSVTYNELQFGALKTQRRERERQTTQTAYRRHHELTKISKLPLTQIISVQDIFFIQFHRTDQPIV